MRPRTSLLGRAAAALTTVGVTLAGTVTLAAAPAQGATKSETPFAYQGSAYGTRVTVGDAERGGLSSGRTAWSVLGCTKMAPIENGERSDVGRINANSFVQVGAVDSLTSSYHKARKERYGSRSVNRVADIVLGAEDGPRLRIGALTTTANAFNEKGRFGATADFDLTGVKALDILPDESETPEELHALLDAIDRTENALIESVIEAAGDRGINIPGLGTLYPAGTARTPRNSQGARSNAYGIRAVLDNGSTVTIGRAWAKIETADPAAVFAGHAYGTEAVVTDGALGLGRTPFQNLPCIGTDGQWRENTIASIDAAGQVVAKGLMAATMGKPRRDGSAVSRARSEIATISLGGGILELTDIVGQVNAFQNRRGRMVKRTLDGTQIGSIVADGEVYTPPLPGEELEIPGIALIRVAVKDLLGTRGIQVHAVQVTMLDGTGLKLNLGTAKTKILR